MRRVCPKSRADGISRTVSGRGADDRRAASRGRPGPGPGQLTLFFGGGDGRPAPAEKEGKTRVSLGGGRQRWGRRWGPETPARGGKTVRKRQASGGG